MRQLPLKDNIDYLPFIKEKVKNSLKNSLEKQVELMLEDYDIYKEPIPYGDIYVNYYSYYKDEDIDNCYKKLKEKLLEDLEDLERFHDDYLSSIEDYYTKEFLTEIINQL